MKIQNLKKQDQGFTLIELLVVITIIAILASFVIPGVQGVRERAYRTKAVNNQRQILLGCNTFAADWDGSFPFGGADEFGDSGSEEPATATNSAEAFNDLVPEYIDTEAIFWIKTKNPEKKFPPTENGELEVEEVSFAYVTGQQTINRSNSPLVSDGEMDTSGAFGEYHPWLNSGKAVVGFVGGHVQEHPLTTRDAGATAMSIDRRVKNIFAERATDEESEGGGFLDTETTNILLPE